MIRRTRDYLKRLIFQVPGSSSDHRSLPSAQFVKANEKVKGCHEMLVEKKSKESPAAVLLFCYQYNIANFTCLMPLPW
jgi:hypothetical protein